MNNITNNYFRIVDLNPTINGGAAPVTDPRDPRALHFFNFKSQGQRLTLGQPTGGTNTRILFSFDYDYFPGGTLMMLPPPSIIHPHGILTIFGPNEMEERYITHHDTMHVLVWLDPTTQPPPVGNSVEVHVKAWRED